MPQFPASLQHYPLQQVLQLRTLMVRFSAMQPGKGRRTNTSKRGNKKYQNYNKVYPRNVAATEAAEAEADVSQKGNKKYQKNYIKTYDTNFRRDVEATEVQN